MSDQYRLYSDLSWLWRMWGDPAGEYAEYTGRLVDWLDRYGHGKYRTALDLGCGGGKFIYSLKNHYEVMGLDLSPQMLSLCAELNPGIPTICADMRQFDLERSFDLIFIDDAISYITSCHDLAVVLRNCHRHMTDGGMAILTLDTCTEDFIQNEVEHFQSIPHHDHPDTSVVYITVNYDPDPTDNTYECLFLYLIRTPQGLRIEQETHLLGVFSIHDWEKTIAESGFDFHPESYEDERRSYRTYLLTKRQAKQ